MIKKNLKTLIITGLIILIPFVWGIMAYHSLPEQIPIHFDFSGNVDNYGPRWIVLIISPILLLIQWAATLEAHFNSKKEEIKNSYIKMMSWTIAACAIAFGAVMYSCAVGNLMTAQRLCPIIVGVLFVAMGNFMPKQKKSRWAGIRVRWTLNDPDNWMKTHRFFGRVSVLCGFAMIGISFIKNLQIVYAVMFVLMLISVFVPLVYSYELSKKTKTE